VGSVSAEFIQANAFLLAFQALLVGLTGAGIPHWLERRFASRAWALILPLSIAVVVAGIELVPELADGLTWIALILVPPGAMLALGWALHGARPAFAAVAAILFVFAWAQTGTLAGDAAAALLTALSAATVGRLLAGGVPADWLKVAIIAMAAIDAILVFGNQLQGPNAVLNAAVPAPGAPQLQYLDLHHASMGYGDVFVAGVYGGVLAAEGTRQWPVAVLVLTLSALWDLLFLLDSINTLPATVPVAVAVILVELRRRLWATQRRPGTSTAS
jgi:hypothetical protein